MSTTTPTAKCYAGHRVLGRAHVDVHVLHEGGVATYQLPHLVRHSPDGFNWGYSGSGPADLARSILADCLGEDPTPQLYQAFKEHFLATLDQDSDWHIGETSICEWLAGQGDAPA